MTDKTDRELLELAAKALGLIVFDWVDRIGFSGLIVRFKYGNDKEWNPLTDDGDRYRLARALKLCIDFATGHVVFQIDEHELMIAFDKGDPVDEAKAIVRAAASIGEQMK